jgi:leucyl-tRNA synthetase
MTFVNEVTKQHASHPEDLRALALLIAPLAPHFGEELWSQIGTGGSIFDEPWPEWNEALTVDEMVTLVVQVNGKKRGTCQVPAGSDQATALEAAKALAAAHLAGKQLVKEIFVPRNMLVNLVVR